MNWKESLERLKTGNTRFVKDQLERKLQNPERKKALTGGQHPFAIILSCADSRVIPELAFDTGLGEIFVVRVAGNVPNPSSIASIEYAVAHLGSKLIVVMGHESCGAVAAAIEGGDNGSNLNHLLSFISPVVEENKNEDMAEIIKQNAMRSSDELVKKSQIISDAVENGEVKIATAYYKLGTGEVEFL